jgi:hypothetical protein
MIAAGLVAVVFGPKTGVIARGRGWPVTLVRRQGDGPVVRACADACSAQ